MNLRLISLSLSALTICTGAHYTYAENIKIDTKNSSLVLQADKGKKLKHLYYGGKISNEDVNNIRQAGGKIYNAYPDYGMH